MSFTDQTKRDLASILETLDQRLHEISTDPAMLHEIAALHSLRASASAMLPIG